MRSIVAAFSVACTISLLVVPAALGGADRRQRSYRGRGRNSLRGPDPHRRAPRPRPHDSSAPPRRRRCDGLNNDRAPYRRADPDRRLGRCDEPARPRLRRPTGTRTSTTTSSPSCGPVSRGHRRRRVLGRPRQQRLHQRRRLPVPARRRRRGPLGLRRLPGAPATLSLYPGGYSGGGVPLTAQATLGVPVRGRRSTSWDGYNESEPPAVADPQRDVAFEGGDGRAGRPPPPTASQKVETDPRASTRSTARSHWHRIKATVATRRGRNRDPLEPARCLRPRAVRRPAARRRRPTMRCQRRPRRKTEKEKRKQEVEEARASQRRRRPRAASTPVAESPSQVEPARARVRAPQLEPPPARPGARQCQLEGPRPRSGASPGGPSPRSGSGAGGRAYVTRASGKNATAATLRLPPGGAYRLRFAVDDLLGRGARAPSTRKGRGTRPSRESCSPPPSSSRSCWSPARPLPHRTQANESLDASVRFLQDVQNPDGGFGGSKGRQSSPVFSAWVALALAAAGINPQDQTKPRRHRRLQLPGRPLRRGARRRECQPSRLHDDPRARTDGGQRRRNRPARLRRRTTWSPRSSAAARRTAPSPTSPAAAADQRHDLRDPRSGAGPGARGAGGDRGRRPTWVESAQQDERRLVLELGQARARSRHDRSRDPGADRRWLAAGSEAVEEGARLPARGPEPRRRLPRLPRRAESNVASTAWAVQGDLVGGREPGNVAHRVRRYEPLDFLASLQEPDGHIRWRREPGPERDLDDRLRRARLRRPRLAVPGAAASLGQPAADAGSQARAMAPTRAEASSPAGAAAGAPLFSRPKPQSQGRTPGRCAVVPASGPDPVDHSDDPARRQHRAAARVRDREPRVVRGEPESVAGSRSAGSGPDGGFRGTGGARRPSTGSGRRQRHGQRRGRGRWSRRARAAGRGHQRPVRTAAGGEVQRHRDRRAPARRRTARSPSAPRACTAPAAMTPVGWPAAAIAAFALLIALGGARWEHRRQALPLVIAALDLGNALADLATALRVPVLIAAIVVLLLCALELGRFGSECWRRRVRARDFDLRRADRAGDRRTAACRLLRPTAPRRDRRRRRWSRSPPPPAADRDAVQPSTRSPATSWRCSGGSTAPACWSAPARRSGLWGP